MRITIILSALIFAVSASAAELESRVLTHYVPQDFLETAVRTEAWTEVPLNLKGGVRKGDVVRIWTGGNPKRRDSEAPRAYAARPAGGTLVSPSSTRRHSGSSTRACYN